jgi:hypothetical protein
MSMNFSSLQALFGNGELPTVVSDSLYVLNRFGECGFRTLRCDEVSTRSVEAPRDVLLIPAIPSVHPDIELISALEKSAVLVTPLLAFANGTKEVDYLIRRLSKLSFEAACKQTLDTVEHIQHANLPIIVESPGCHLMIELGDNVDLMVPKVSANISTGQFISIIQYLEIGLVPNSDNSSFVVNGTLLCEGITVAHHLHSHYQSGPIADEAWRRFDNLRLSGRFPLVLEVKNSRLRSIFTRDGVDVLDIILPLTDEVMQGGLTEVGFGSLFHSDDTDWTINSQLNEPAGGVHLGIGAGESAAHIDFVSPRAICHWGAN